MKKIKYYPKIYILIIFILLPTSNGYSNQNYLDDSTDNYKSINISAGIGNIEFLNINLSKRVVSGVYLNLSFGHTFVQDRGNWPMGGGFIKGGMSWKIFNNDITPIISVDAGKVYLNVGESFPPYHMVSDNALLISMLAGVETQFKSGFFFSIRVGERFSRREFEKDQYITGLQISFGWSF